MPAPLTVAVAQPTTRPLHVEANVGGGYTTPAGSSTVWDAEGAVLARCVADPDDVVAVRLLAAAPSH